MNFFIKTHLNRRHCRNILLTVKLTAILFLALSLSLKAQPAMQVNGTVKDTNGEPLAGVNVSIKGSRIATITDGNGAFGFNLPTGNKILLFTYMGFEPKEVRVAGSSKLNVVLEESTAALDEVVVVGYGTMKKRDLTGAVSSVKAEDITLSPVTNAMEALQGRVSGLDIQRTSGRSGTNPEVLLRGNRSIAGSQSPMYIIDGIPSSVNNLNPNDIESIDVLKDAASTSIYGASAANGVIIITTKKAKAGLTQIDLNTYYGINGFASFPQPLTGEKWLDYKRDRFFISNGFRPTDLADLGLNADVVKAIEEGKWVNWVDEVLKTGIQQNHHLSIKGGTEKTQAYLSLGFIGEKGIYQNDAVKVYNGRGGIDVKYNNMIKAGFQSFLNYRSGESTNSRVNKAYSIYPLGTPYDESGVVNLYPIPGDPNNVSLLANNYPGAFASESRSYNIQFNPYVEFTPMKGLSLRSNFGVGLSNSRSGSFQGINSYNLLMEGRTLSEATYNMGTGYSYLWENILGYNFRLSKDHEFTATAISSWSDSRSESTNLGGNGIDYEELQFYSMSSIKNLNTHSNSYSQTNKLSFAGRLNYGYKGKYLLQLTNRWDGASQLATGNKWSSFPSASAAWRISEEPFMRGTRNWLSNAKIRGGYGEVGNSGIPAYVSLTRTASRTGTLSLGGGAAIPVYTPTRDISNPELTWERSVNANIGLDLSFLKNRIDFSAEYYKTNTNGILWDRRLPSTSGSYDAKTPYVKTMNIASSENKGLELTLSSRNIVKKDLQWQTTLTFTTATEKLVDIDLGNLTVDELISEGLFLGQTPARNGVFYGYKKIGIWQFGEEEEAAKYGAVPGDIKLQTVPQFDANGVSDDGVHTYATNKDRMIVGSIVPDFFFGVQNAIRYKNIDLTIFVNGRYGHMIDAQVLGYWNREAQPETYNYWLPDNATNDFPRPGSNFSNNFASALQLVDGSHVKIKNVTLGYTLPQQLGKRLGLKHLRVYGTAYNPVIITRSHLLKNVDPENGGADSFPLFKQLVFGINLSL